MNRLTLWAAALLCLARLLRAGDVSPGLEELYRLDRLPQFKTSVKVGSFSSYDRSGGNDDGFSGKYSYLRKDDQGLVLAELKGPGVIYRIWTPTPSDDLIEFFFDGEETPRLQVKFREMFLGNHPAFPHPLAGFGAGGFYSYVPLPFARSCLVRARADKVQFYQINYALYPADLALGSFDPKLAAAYLQQRQVACDLWAQAGGDVSRFSSPPGAPVQITRSRVSLPPRGKATVFEATEGGRIVGLRMSPASALASQLRACSLSITFDGAPPAVLCPVGDFFGYAWGEPAMRSLLVGTAGETNYCYFPMPYDRSVSIALLSETSTALDLQVEIMHTQVPRAANEGRFYAVWRRENPTRLGEPYTFVEAQGRGHLVGVALQAQGFESGKTLFFEGDDETVLDRELVIHGTGSEDFFNGGWYDVPDRWEKRLSFPLSGCLGYAKHLSRTGGYRFFLGDAYAFGQSIRQTIEHSGEKNNIPTDYCSVAYLYADQPPSGAGGLPPLPQRAVADLEEVVFPAWWQLPMAAWSFERASLSRKKETVEGQEVRYLSFTGQGQDWFGPQFLSPVCDVPQSAEYDIYIEAVRGPAQGKVQLFQNENAVAEPVDLSAETRRLSRRVRLGRLWLDQGRNSLMLKLVGKSEPGSVQGLDLISIVCRRSPSSANHGAPRF